MINQKTHPSNIVKSYWQGGVNRGVKISIIKEKKIDSENQERGMPGCSRCTITVMSNAVIT